MNLDRYFPILVLESTKERLLSLLPELHVSEGEIQKPQDTLATTEGNVLKVEWIVDVADASGMWFIGTAYNFIDSTLPELKVMIPDIFEPSWEGPILLDPRSIRLLECEDDFSVALFKRILRSSVVDVDWELEWWDEAGEDQEHQNEGEIEKAGGCWRKATARLYVRMGGFLLVEKGDGAMMVVIEEEEENEEGVMVKTMTKSLRRKGEWADRFQKVPISKEGIRLLESGLRGREEFQELVDEGLVQGPKGNAEEHTHKSEDIEQKIALEESELEKLPSWAWPTASLSLSAKGQLTALTELIRSIETPLKDALEAREDAITSSSNTFSLFKNFIFQGDLFAGDDVSQPVSTRTFQAQEESIRRVRCYEQALIKTLGSRESTKHLQNRVRDSLRNGWQDEAQQAREDLAIQKTDLEKELRRAIKEEEDLNLRYDDLQAERRRLRDILRSYRRSRGDKTFRGTGYIAAVA